MAEKAYKYRIYPNKNKQELIQKTFGCTRFVYNYYLNKRKEMYENDKTTFTCNMCSKDLTQLKKELEWLKEPDKDSLQKALKDLDMAYQKFFKEHTGYPKFKSKKNRYKSYRTSCTNNNIRFDPRLEVGEDTCFTTEYLSASSKCCVIQKCYYHLVVRSTSTIFTYEKDPMAILAGKKALLIGRRELTERIKKRTGYDIEELWYGTVVMSAIQLALQLSHPIKGKSYRERYQCWKGYLTERETVRAIEGLKLKNGSLKSVPFRMLKNHWDGLIFGCSRLVQLFPYKFKR